MVETCSKQCRCKLSQMNFGYKLISFFYPEQKIVCRTSDFIGILSDFLVELAATPVLTEVSVFLVELFATLPLTEVTLPARSYFQHASPLSPPDKENPYSTKTRA